MFLLNFMLCRDPKTGQWRNQHASEPAIGEWMATFLDEFKGMFEQAKSLAIESPQRRRIFSVMAHELKHQVLRKFPHIRVLMVDPRERTKLFNSSADTYAQRKLNSWEVFGKYFGEDALQKAKQAFAKRGKPSKSNKLGAVVYHPDPAEALGYALGSYMKEKEWTQNQRKPERLYRNPPVDTVRVRAFTAKLACK